MKGTFPMNFNVKGDSDNPIVEIQLQKDEQVKIEPRAMVYLRNVNIQGQTNSKTKGIGGFIRAAARSVASGESVFITYATGEKDNSIIGIAPSIPGKIAKLSIDDNAQYCLNTGAFLACDSTVDYNIKRQSVGKAVFANTGGLFVMETEGKGDVLVNAFGDLMEIEVTPDDPIIIDNEHVVAWDTSLSYDLKIASGTFGFMTGEGIVNEFSGRGKVIIQSRNIHNLADVIAPFIPTSS
jgi:uncharacterized protein (TIGR00266 family)